MNCMYNNFLRVLSTGALYSQQLHWAAAMKPPTTCSCGVLQDMTRGYVTPIDESESDSHSLWFEFGVKWLGFERLLPPPALENNNINHYIKTESTLICGLNSAFRYDLSKEWISSCGRESGAGGNPGSTGWAGGALQPYCSGWVCQGWGSPSQRVGMRLRKSQRNSIHLSLPPSCFSAPLKGSSLPAQVQSCCLFTASWKSEGGGRGSQTEEAVSQLFSASSSAGHSTEVEVSSVVGVFTQPQGFLKSGNKLDSLLWWLGKG